ncbi:hypothetical protein [Flavobacterium ajazii]|uniref:hypothetical protein n=1 Tax=Flavobacterium ajazii TaxID=2692318 RepID=UPI0013D16FDF|nr:hypothetical protein [Flavobacterium ajazii]
MKKFTLSVCCNCIGTNYPFFRDVAVSSLKQDFSEDVNEHECSNLSSDGKSIISLILLIGLFLFSNFSAAQVITIDGQTGDWSGNSSVKHVQDAFGNGVVDNQFTEGSKDFLLASNLSWVIGQTKAKNDIANGGFGLANQVKYVDANNVTQTLNGSFLVFAGDRTSNNGDAQIGFWFYLNATAPVEINGSRYFAPPHVRGDLLVLADFTGGGRLGTVKVYRWIGGGAVTPGSSVVPNTDGNLETTNIASIVAENNTGNSTVPAGWNFTSGQYQANEFYEGFVDLGAIGGNTNFTCSATVLLETRSSQSVTASLDDFIGSTLGNVPTVTVNSPTVCDGQSATITATPGSPGNYTYSWTVPQGANNPGNVASFSATIGGTYSVIITNQEGCPSLSGSGTFTVKPVATVSVNNPSVCNGTSATLTATPSLAGGTYLWNTGATTASITVSPSETTIYSVVYTLNGCPSPSASGTVTVKPVPTVSVNSPSVCNGTSATLTATPSLPGGTYLWNTGATTASITVTPSETTIYSVVYTLDGCPSPSASGTVTVKPVPTVSVNSPSVCNGTSATLTATPSLPGGTYLWNTGATTASITVTPSETTIYSVVYTLDGCPGPSASGTVTVKPVPTVSVNSPSVCNGTSATLTATPSLAGGTYLWNTGATTASITVSPSSTTTYSVVYTLDGCPSPSASGTVTVKPVPTVSVNNPSVCNGTSATLTATPSLAGGTYLWNTGATTASITVRILWFIL